MVASFVPGSGTTRPSRRTHRVVAFFVVMAALLASLMLAVPALAAEDEAEAVEVSWGVRPADTVQGSGRPNFDYRLPSGGVLSDAIIVTNHGTQSVTLQVYAADGFLTTDGSLDLIPSGEESTQLGSWIRLASTEVTIAADSSMQVPFELTVPEGIQPGDYAAGVVASLSGTEGGITTERRLGSRIMLRVEGALVPGVAVTDVSFRHEGTQVPLGSSGGEVSFTVSNTGNARVTAQPDVTIAGPLGLGVVSVPTDAIDLLPGSELTLSIPVESIAQLGLLTADVSVAAEVIQRTGDSSELPDVVTATGSATVWAMPWTTLAIVLLIAGIIVWRVRAMRAAKQRQQRAVDDAVAAALAEREQEPVG